MLRLLADENFSGRILRGLLRNQPQLDIVRAQDTVIAGRDDATVLSWAAAEGHVLLTHDVRTIPKFAFDRVREGLPMPGVFEADDTAPIGEIIEDILLLAEASGDAEWEGQVIYVPFPRK